MALDPIEDAAIAAIETNMGAAWSEWWL